jgi:hypothetical protein
MRMTVPMLFVLSLGAWSQVPAAEPQLPGLLNVPTTSAPQSAVAPADEHSAAASGNSQNTAAPQPAAPAAAPAAAKTDPNKPEITAEDKDLLARGYKLKVRNGDKWFCKREAELGSHVERENCNTAESIMRQRAESMETVREIQANKPNPSN